MGVSPSALTATVASHLGKLRLGVNNSPSARARAEPRPDTPGSRPRVSSGLGRRAPRQAVGSFLLQGSNHISRQCLDSAVGWRNRDSWAATACEARPHSGQGPRRQTHLEPFITTACGAHPHNHRSPGNRSPQPLHRGGVQILMFDSTNFHGRGFPGQKGSCPGPGQGAQAVRVSCVCTRVAGSIPGEGTCKTQAMRTPITGTTNQRFSLSLSSHLSY